MPDRPIALDEYPIHQVPLSLRHVATGDRNAYDRCIFHVMDHSGRALLIAGLGVYPNTGVIDAYATLRLGDRLHAVRASDALTDDRLALTVGPLTVTVEEPLTRLRLTCAADPGDPDGLAYDLTWHAAFPATWEPHHTQYRGDRLMLEGRRFVQAGTCTGRIRVAGQELAVTAGSGPAPATAAGASARSPARTADGPRRRCGPRASTGSGARCASTTAS